MSVQTEGVFLAFKDCGCVAVIISDMRDKWTEDEVGRCIKQGYRVDRLSWESYRAGFESGSLTYSHKCPHVPAAPRQGGLFAELPK